jgi:mobilization protein NikA
MKDDPNNPKRHITVPHGGAITSAVDAVRAAVVQEPRGLVPVKPMKVGRPKLPTGIAKGRVMHVRLTPEEIERINASAKASNKTISEWIRSTLNAAIES